MDSLKMHSKNITEENIEKIAALFPNCIIEATDEQGRLRKKIDFDLLRQELSWEIVEGQQERYQLNWPGKRLALLTSNAPIAKTLRPYRKESVDFDKTQNLFIEGDNLDALKLLQETYLGKVKMIYIDPPYNTGNDFIYEDDFAENTDEFLKRSSQKDENGNLLVANTEANGRFHSDWLSMVYSRLKLAKNLLSENGIIFISIDDCESPNLRKICDEIFGENKFIAQLIWKSRQNKDNRTKNGASIDHEYVIAYGKVIRGVERDLKGYLNSDNDPRGDWTSANMVGLATADRRPNLHYVLVDPATGITYGCPPMGWRYDKNTMARLISEGRILWPSSSDGRPRKKSFLNELSSERTGYSSIIGTDIYTRNGTADIIELFGYRSMDFPKPVDLIKELINQANLEKDEIVLDFFSGSATTAHALMELNAEDGGERKFIMIQIPEACDEKSEAYKSGYKTIAEISKQRIRLAGKKIKEVNAVKKDIDKLDIGFRVLKVDSSNMLDVYYTTNTIHQDLLTQHIDNVKPDRTPEDLLFQVLLDWGVDLTLPITKKIIHDHEVFFIDEDALLACFDNDGKITEEFVKQLTQYSPLRVVFRDDGFTSDSVKINVTQIFKQLSPHTEVKTI